MSTEHRRPGPGRQRLRAAHPAAATFIKRAIPPYEMLEEEQLVDIETHADRILQEIGMEIRGDADAIRLWKDAGAEIEGESRVRVPMGLARQIVKRSAPAQFTQHSRNPARSVTIGGRATVFAPAYGPPFVSCADRGRRYGTLEDASRRTCQSTNATSTCCTRT
jgi:trimethylamine--corrinoid protein Co-methyltransferase